MRNLILTALVLVTFIMSTCGPPPTAIRATLDEKWEAPVYKLTAVKDKEPEVWSVKSPLLDAIQPLKTLIILPPKKANADQYVHWLSDIESHFLDAGIFLIDSAVLVDFFYQPYAKWLRDGDYLDLSDKDNELFENLQEYIQFLRELAGISGQPLGMSYLERAILMGSKVGAQAVFQIGVDERSYYGGFRYFIASIDDPGKAFREVDQLEYEKWDQIKFRLVSDLMKFEGRLISIPNGEVLARFEITIPDNYSLVEDFEADIQVFQTLPQTLSQAQVNDLTAGLDASTLATLMSSYVSGSGGRMVLRDNLTPDERDTTLGIVNTHWDEYFRPYFLPSIPEETTDNGSLYTYGKGWREFAYKVLQTNYDYEYGAFWEIAQRKTREKIMESIIQLIKP
jgi:hypothetical protein